MQLTSCRGTCRRPDQGARCASPVSCDFLTFHRAVDFRVESSIIGSEVAGTVGCNSRIILATGDIVGLQETRIEKSQVSPMLQADSLSFFFTIDENHTAWILLSSRSNAVRLCFLSILQ